jgi:hypothetical protein
MGLIGRLIKAPFKAVVALVGFLVGVVGITLIQAVYFLCFGLWIGGAAVLLGILLRLTRVFAPFGTDLMRSGFDAMFIDGETIQGWLGNDD